MIPLRDQSDLEWFFGPGSATYQRSIMGGILDKISLFAVKHEVDAEVTEARRVRIAKRRFDQEVPGEITARPTAEVTDSGRSEPDGNDLVRYGRVSRRLARVSSRHQTILAAYFGDSAARWARETGMMGRIGKLGPVLLLTASGRELIERDRRKARGAKLDLSDAQRIENVVGREEQSPDGPAKSLIERAMDEAREAVEHAAVEWLTTEPPRRGD